MQSRTAQVQIPLSILQEAGYVSYVAQTRGNEEKRKSFFTNPLLPLLNDIDDRLCLGRGHVLPHYKPTQLRAYAKDDARRIFEDGDMPVIAKDAIQHNTIVLRNIAAEIYDVMSSSSRSTCRARLYVYSSGWPQTLEVVGDYQVVVHNHNVNGNFPADRGSLESYAIIMNTGEARNRLKRFKPEFDFRDGAVLLAKYFLEKL